MILYEKCTSIIQIKSIVVGMFKIGNLCKHLCKLELVLPIGIKKLILQPLQVKLFILIDPSGCTMWWLQHFYKAPSLPIMRNNIVGQWRGSSFVTCIRTGPTSSTTLTELNNHQIYHNTTTKPFI